MKFFDALRSELVRARPDGLARWIPYRIVPEHSRLPRFYGYAWQRFDVNARVAMPVPLNLVAWVLRELWFRAKEGPGGMERLLAENRRLSRQYVELEAAYAKLDHKRAELEKAVDWVLADSSFKAPEQYGEVPARWLERLHDVRKKYGYA